MLAKRLSRRIGASALAGFVALVLLAGQASAGQGVIALANSDCFLISTPTGYAMVAGITTATPGTVVLGRFGQPGVAKIVNSKGVDVAVDPYVFSVGLTRAEVRKKWSANCTVQGRSDVYVDLSDRR